ncbi:sodium:calcium antiporter [Halorarum halophilum]|uniref:Sodium:calcium antiporter n=1 Tax=Halorarum halophilum TaxID=2743090 RepID=A0A7D5K5Z3_9EURY|nr:sodium:calcium antiporter [Halobaculum halophilum]QLG26279.1 sodium:calcium antiporter [Halobaculum halophilum]
MGPESFVVDSVLLSALVFLVGVGVVLVSVEKFIEYVAEAALHFGVSAFLLTVLFAGADIENAALALAAMGGDLPDVALGVVLGVGVFVLTFTVGLAGVLTPFEVSTPRPYLAITLASPTLVLVLSLDGTLSRMDGAVLFVAYLPILLLLYRWETSGETRYFDDEGLEAEFRADRETGETASTNPRSSTLRAKLLALVLVFATVVGMTIGAEATVIGARGLLAASGLSGLAFGATILAVIASLEEILLTVEPVRRNRPEIGVGNVIGSVLFFVTANVGVIALVRPITVTQAVFSIHWPFLVGSLLVVLALFYRGEVTRAGGTLLLLLYGAYWLAIYVL